MKKVLSFLAAIVLLGAFASSAWGYDFSATAPSGQTLYYNIVNGEAHLVRPGTGSSYDNYVTGALTIPSSVSYNGTTYAVTASDTVGSYGAFDGCSGLTSITIPNSVTTIGNQAFYGCTGLTSITIPNSVTAIGTAAFYNCTGLTSVTIPNSVTSIGNQAFQNCSGLTSVTIGSGVTSIGNYAFYQCTSLTSVTIGSGVTSIGQCAFYNCSGLTSVTIPNSVTSIGERAFYYCSGLTSVIFNADSCISAGSSSYPAFAGCTNLTNITFGNNVKRIPNNLCCYCSGLTSVSIPNSVTSIGERAFYYCSGLTTVTIGSGVTSIGNYAFQSCSGLTSVTIPNSVTLIGNSAFYGCSGLTTVTIGSGVTSIGNYAFQSCSGLTSVTIPNSVTTLGDHAFYGCSGLTSVTIPNSVTSIDSYAFYGCSGLTSVTIPNSVTSIGNYAFQNCSGLTSVTIPNSVNTIGYWTFSSCSSLDTLIVGSGLTTIAQGAFEYDHIKVLSYNSPIVLSNIDKSQLQSVTIGDAITSIGISSSSSAFVGCSSLTTVTIGSGVTSIGSQAFRYCSSLDTVYMMPATPPSLGSNAFSDNASGRVFIIAGCAYNNYYGSYSWNSYQGALRTPTININVTVQSSNTSRGTANVVLGPNNHIVRCDSTVVVQAAANSNYHFDHWSNGSTANPDTVALTGDITITAYFIGLTVTSNNNSRGSVTRSKIGDHLEKISATANSNYHFDHWSNGSTANPDTVTLTGDSIITAYFLPNQYTITGTSANSARGTVTGSATVDYLDTVILTANANYGYHIDHWTYTNQNNNNTSTQTGGNTLTLVANKNRTATAYFSPNQYQLTLNVDNSSHGTVTGGGTYDYLTSHTITATANTGYHFDHWSNGTTSASTTITLTGDSTVTAYFERNSYNLTVNVNNTSLGTVATPDGTSALYQDTLIAVATPIDHHHVASWQGQGIVATSADKDTVWVRMESNRTLTCNFAIDTHTVAATASDIARGSVSGGGNYAYGTPCTVEATAYTGYTFQSWSNGVTANPYTFAVLEDVELTAIFVSPGEQTYTVTVSVNDPAMGSATVNGNATASVLGGTEVTLTATPNSGYRFVRWDDNNTEATRTITVTSNMSFTAIFMADGGTEGIEDIDAANIKVYAADGRIVVEGTTDEVRVYDMMGRMITHSSGTHASTTATRRSPSSNLEEERDGRLLFNVPASGVYLIKVDILPAKKVVVMKR